jgi:hypothetical protein
VRIACDGEVNELDVPKIQPATVPIYDEIFQREECVSTLSRFMGIPLAVRKIPIDDYWEMNKNNVEAAVLFRNCDLSSAETIAGPEPPAAPLLAPPTPDGQAATPSSSHSNASDSGVRSSSRGGRSVGASASGRDVRSPDLPIFNGFGGIPSAWNPSDIGPVLVVRLDRKPLHPLHGAAIVTFLTHTLRRPFTELIDAEQRRAWQHALMMAGTGITDPQTAAAAWVSERDVFEGRRNVLGLVSQARFSEFFEQYKARRVDGQADLLGGAEAEMEQDMDKWSVQLEETEPKPEWQDVLSPYDV